ncbi:MAG: hypothetical protein ACI8PZ_006752, partial [Myxococcota bacterium]
ARIVDSRGDTVLLAGQQAMVVAEGVVLEAPAPLDGAPLWGPGDALLVDLLGTGWIAGPGGAAVVEARTESASWSPDGAHLLARVDGTDGPELRVWTAAGATVDVPPMAGVVLAGWVDAGRIAVHLPEARLTLALVLLDIERSTSRPLGTVFKGIAHAGGVVALVPEGVEAPPPGVVAATRAWDVAGRPRDSLSSPVFTSSPAWGHDAVWGVAWVPPSTQLARLGPAPTLLPTPGDVAVDGRLWPAPAGRCIAAAVRTEGGPGRADQPPAPKASDALAVACGDAVRQWPVAGPVDAAWSADGATLAVRAADGVWVGPVEGQPVHVAAAAATLAVADGRVRVGAADGAVAWFGADGAALGALDAVSGEGPGAAWGGQPTVLVADRHRLQGEAAPLAAWSEAGGVVLVEAEAVRVLTW